MTPDQLRQLADDMEQRPGEACWRWVRESECEIGSGVETPREAMKMLRYWALRWERLPPTITRTITHPMPVTKPLEDGQEYWVSDYEGVMSSGWDDAPTDRYRLNAGCIFLTREDAEAHFEAHYRGWRE